MKDIKIIYFDIDGTLIDMKNRYLADLRCKNLKLARLEKENERLKKENEELKERQKYAII